MQIQSPWPEVYYKIVNSLKNYPSGGLMILSSGISIVNITTLFLTHFLEKNKFIILLLNYSNNEIEYINTQINYYATLNQLINNKELALEVIILSKIPSEKRSQYYKSGGIFSLTNQILMQDLLNNILSPFIVTHLIISQAHSIKKQYDYESWITNYIKIQKPELFCLALTNQISILHFQQSTNNLLKYLYLNEIILWPINRAEIVNCLKTQDLSWQELKINLNQQEMDIQNIIIDLIQQCLISVNGKCGTTFLTSSMILQQNPQMLKAIIQRQQFKLDLASYQTFLDIFQLRKLLLALVSQNSFQFYLTLTRVIQQAELDSIWFVAHQDIQTKIDKLNKLTQERIFIFKTIKEPKMYKFQKSNGEIIEKQLDISIQFNLQINKKLDLISKILDDLQLINETQHNNNHNRIWIWVRSIENVTNIQNYLVARYKKKDKKNLINSFNFLRQALQLKQKNIDNLLNTQQDNGQQQSVKKQKIILKHNKKIINKTTQYDQEQLLLSLLHQELNDYYADVLEQKENILLQKDQILSMKENKYEFLPQELLDLDLSITGEKVNNNGVVIVFEEDNIIPQTTIVVNNISDDCQRLSFQENFKPDAIIMMEPHHSFLKELLIHEYMPKLYVIFQNECVETWQYYKEKLDEEVSFEQTVQGYKNIIQFQEKPEDAIHSFKIQAQENTREGKGVDFFRIQNEANRILVDYREFRSDVPAKLYFNGFHLTPVMLKTGDIVLSNNCAIERKAVETGDLIESLNQNRLEQQLQKMNQFDHPFLLIEFSDNIPFNLNSLMKQSQYQNNNTRIMVRLLEMILKYSKIQILWSNNSDDTVKIIQRLKQTLARNTPDIQIFKSNLQQKEFSNQITNYFQQIDQVID